MKEKFNYVFRHLQQVEQALVHGPPSTWGSKGLHYTRSYMVILALVLI